MDRNEIRKLIDTVPQWYHRIELAPGLVTPGVNDSPTGLTLLNLPTDLSGQRVLDVGARDGFYSFECERRGAEVVAIDYVPPDRTGFQVAREVLQSRVELRHANLYSVTPEKYGHFDLVLCLGVLYHLRDPMLGLDTLRAVARGRLMLESLVIPDPLPEMEGVPLMQFYPRNSKDKDFSNYWGPTMKCLELMLEEAGFSVRRKVSNGDRGVFDCVVKEDEWLQYMGKISRGLA